MSHPVVNILSAAKETLHTWSSCLHLPPPILDTTMVLTGFWINGIISVCAADISKRSSAVRTPGFLRTNTNCQTFKVFSSLIFYWGFYILDIEILRFKQFETWEGKLLLDKTTDHHSPIPLFPLSPRAELTSPELCSCTQTDLQFLFIFFKVYWRDNG